LSKDSLVTLPIIIAKGHGAIGIHLGGIKNSSVINTTIPDFIQGRKNDESTKER
jgi:hypothetical protein